MHSICKVLRFSFFFPCQSVLFYLLMVGVEGYYFSCSHSMTHTHTQQDSSGRGIGVSQRPPPDNTQHSQETDIHASSEFRTRNARKREATDLRVRTRGHWDWRIAICEAYLHPACKCVYKLMHVML